MTTIPEHPLRFEIANELHARPFPRIEAPGRVAYLALKPDGTGADRAAEMRAHLIDLLDRYGAPHPAPEASQYSGQLGRLYLKWERHTEFVTFTLWDTGTAPTPFDASTFKMFPKDWLEAAPGVRITSALVRVERHDGDDGISEKVGDWFVQESVALSRVLNDKLVIAGDFRIDTAGHMRFAVFARNDCGPRRIGRVVQRLCEIETYKAMAMLGLFEARDTNKDVAALEGQLARLIGDMSGASPDETLGQLLDVSAELETIGARKAYRSAATKAYETIVMQRIKVLREDHFRGRQTFAEFMIRRFDPAMRTVESSDARLVALTERARRAGELLRTRVEVERQSQNQDLLRSMDHRADLQLRLQQTVEGLSVVAISYYALNLLRYLLGPVAGEVGIGKDLLTGLLVLPVVVGVWALVRRIRKRFH